MNKYKKQNIYSILTLLIPLIVVFSVYFSFSNEEEVVEEKTVVTEVKTYRNPYENIYIEGQAAIVKDLNTGEVIYQKNANTSLPLASITKVMTGLVSYRMSDPNQNIMITLDSLNTEGESYLSLGESFKFKDLLDLMLINSSNDGAAAIANSIERNAENAFVNQMNYTAKQIGMNNSYFLNETGLDIDLINAGAFGSASDVAKLFEYTLSNYPEVLESTKELVLLKYSQNGILHRVENTNEIIPKLNNLIASKTGFTDIAGGNLAVVVDPGLNRPIAIVVLGSTYDGRFNDVLKLSNSLTEYFEYEERNN